MPPRPALRLPRLPRLTRPHSTTPASIYARRLDVLLATPTWSVRTLLPPAAAPAAREISPETLHHLLRLSALPPPETPEQEQSLLDALEAHLHFVRGMQKVDTEGVRPLVRIEEELGGRAVRFEEMVGEGAAEMRKWQPTKLARREAGGFYVLEEMEEK